MPIPVCSASQFFEQRVSAQTDFPVAERTIVSEIINRVQKQGDEALIGYTKEFDGVELGALQVSGAELSAAQQKIKPELLTALHEAASNIEKFHRRQLRADWYDETKNTKIGQRFLPLNRVGAYVPGGTAAYPSSVLMTVIPARVAGVKEIYICTPPDDKGDVNSLTLAAACEAGATAVFKVGGAQAIAAMAFGTQTVPRVDKIVGPGNIYVTLAKKELFGTVGIDMLAGPSEIVIVADQQANASYIAADLLSQAEHDPLSKPILITTSEKLAYQVIEELKEQLLTLPRREVAIKSLQEQGAAIIVPDLEAVWPLVNTIAPEHLELQLKDPWRYLDRVTCAGTVFIGPFTPEPLGDYWAGSNHVLPTNSTARYASALGVDDFIKRSQVLCYRDEALSQSAAQIAALARAEGLEAHARAVLIRGKQDEPTRKS
jgi:histidinol dehydrogenase